MGRSGCMRRRTTGCMSSVRGRRLSASQRLALPALVFVANAYVLIVDYIGLDRRRHVTWNLPHLGKSEISERAARIVRPNAVLEVRCLADERPVYPMRTTFPLLSRWNVGKAATEWNVNDHCRVLSFNTCLEEGVQLWPFVAFPLRPDEAAR